MAWHIIAKTVFPEEWNSPILSLMRVALAKGTKNEVYNWLAENFKRLSQQQAYISIGVYCNGELKEVFSSDGTFLKCCQIKRPKE